MSNVTPIRPEPAELGTWFCNCDSFSFRLREDGVAICLLCGAEHSAGEDGAWRFPPVTPLLPCPDDPRVITEYGSADLALKRVLSRVDAKETVALIVVQNSGSVHAWGDNFDTPKRKAWLGRYLRLARDLLQRS